MEVIHLMRTGMFRFKKWLTSFRCTMYFVFQEEERS